LSQQLAADESLDATGGVEAVHLSNLWAVKALKNYA
jgi:hypothetical protein